MRMTFKYVGLLAVLPLLAVALADQSVTDADALKSKGVGASAFGKSTADIVCGDRLCSEYPGGRDAFEERLSTVSSAGSVPGAPGESMAGDGHGQGQAGEGGLDSVLRLSRASVPATIPMHMGYYDDQPVYYIITDASDPAHADVITEQQGWQVELAPVLETAPDSALSRTYFFTNGVPGDGIHGFQNQVLTSIPGQERYSALTSHVHVAWVDQDNVRELTSESAIMDAAQNGEVELLDLSAVVNMPQIVWPGGQMMVADKVLQDDTPYGGGQVLDIDMEEMEVTFIAHRGWGPDGRTIYYIVTDATPSGPADMMGVVSTPSSAGLINSGAAVNLFQFRNGIGGSGPLGFQPGIAAGAPGDANYSPMWRIFLVGWENPEDAAVMETIGDINAYRDAGLVSVGIARPMDSDHIVNCPFIDPFQ